MREIKFRVWDTDEKYMYEVKENNLSLYPAYRYTLMQFTNLHDKNGKEIYEADVVHCEDTMTTPDKTFRTDEPKEVTFSDGAFRYDGITLGDMTTANHITFEVIGNIYENPELVTSTI